MFVTLAVAIVGLGVSCKKDAVEEFVVPSESILVSMPGEVGTTSFASHNITSVSATNVPTGWEIINIDMYAKTITVKAPESFDNEEVESGTLSIIGYTPTGSTKSVDIYLAIVPSEVDYRNAPANCYIANKAATRFMFDPYVGGSNIPLATDHIALIWETSVGLIKYIDMRDGVARFYIQPELDDNDEPTGNVDPARSYEIVDLLKAINECGTTVLMVTHQHDLVRYFGGRIININKGSVVFDEAIGGADEA